MAYIDIQYDPNWEAFQKSYQASHPLVQTDAEKADQAKLDAFLQGLYDPKSSNYQQYTGNFQALFPGVIQWRQQQEDYNKAMADAFQQQYGHSAIGGITVSGPPMAAGTPTSPEATTPPVTIPAVTTPVTTTPATTTTTTPTPEVTTPTRRNTEGLVQPPTSSSVRLRPLVTAPAGGYKIPDLLSQTRKRWGFGSM